MSWLFSRSKYRPPFKLKAYNKETKEWEDIDTFNAPVRFSEIKDQIEELLEEGYTRFRLEDSKSNKVWVKYYKSRERSEEDVADRFLSMMEKWSSIMEKMSQIAMPRYDPNELLASQVSMFLTIRNFCEKFPSICGMSEKSDMLENVLIQVLMSRLGHQPQPPAQQVPQMPSAAALAAPARPTEEGVKVTNEIIEKALKETAEIWETECKVLGVCREEGGD